MVDFVDLHAHSTFSNLDGFGTPEQMVLRAKDIGRANLALTDHGSVSGLVRLNKACKENGIKPIFGCEFYIVDSLSAMYENKQRSKNHITVVASNLDGYGNLLRLASDAYQKGFYFKPTIDKELLFEHEKGLIVLSGCWNSMLQNKLKDNQLAEAEELVKEFRHVFGDRYFLETQHFPLFQETIDRFQFLSEKLNIPMALTCDPHYLTRDQAPIQEILHAIRDRRTFDEKQIIKGAYQWPADDLLKAVQHLFPKMPWEQLFENVCAIADRCDVEMPMGGVPRFPRDPSVPIEDLFLAECKKGIERRGLAGRGDEYRARFKREFDLILSKDFADYFLIVADMVNWAKRNGIFVGPARGSAAGSLVCYIMGITEIDPLEHGLLFERFIEEDRLDMPDIDIDFEDERRDLVKEYMSERYGANRVCNVATFAQFRGKNSLDEIGKAFRIPSGDISTVKKYLITRSGGDMRNQLTIQDTFEMSPEAKEVAEKYPDISYAEILEGQLRHMSMHAAGLIVGDRPLDEVIALYKKDDKILGSIEMKDAFSIGLLKIDVLGITELTILRAVCDEIGWTLEDLYNVPLDDEETIKGFLELDVSGVFQFDGDSTKSVLRQLPRLDFEQLTACVALSKPGPSHCAYKKSLVYDCDTQRVIRIEEAHRNRAQRTLSLMPDGSIAPQKIKQVIKTGVQPLYTVKIQLGSRTVGISTTSEHLFMTNLGWQRLGDLGEGSKVHCTDRAIWRRKSDLMEYNEYGRGGKFASHRQPWNAGCKFPGMADSRKQDWKHGVYDQNVERWKEWHDDPNNAEMVRKNALNASRQRSLYLAKMTPEERREALSDFIAAGQIGGYGHWDYASDGHRTESYFELAFEEFLIEHQIDHEPHPFLYSTPAGGRRRADQLICGVYVELDGMDRDPEFYREKYSNGEPYIVIQKDDDWLQMLDFALEVPTNHDWLSISFGEIKSIEYAGEDETYDIEMEGEPNYIANGVVVHNSGSTTNYIARARGGTGPALDWHPTLKEVTDPTFGQIIFQEQVMNIAKIVGKLSVANSTKIRAAMSKSQGEQIFESYWEEFCQGAGENGIDRTMSRKIWEAMKTMGRWAFNKPHAVSYAMVAFWSMYCKRHFPLQFYYARLMKESEKDKRIRLLIEIQKRGIPIYSPVLGKSKEQWTIEGEGLRAGLLEIHSVGEKVANALVQQDYRTREDFVKKKNRGVTKRVLEALEKCNAFDPAGDPDFFGLDHYLILDHISPKRQILFDVEDFADEYQIEVAGFFKEMNYKDVHEEARSRGRSTDNIRNPEIAKYAMLLLEDETDRCLVNVDRYAFAKVGQKVWDAYSNGNAVVVKGKKVGGWRIVRAHSVEVYDANGVLID